MPIDLQHAVPWGRSFSEYVRMFSLTDAELGQWRILDCGAGPSSFNAELSAREPASRVTSCDPIYSHSAAEIRRRVEETYPTLIEGARREAYRFVWSEGGMRDPDHLGQVRLAAMERFLADFDAGKAAGKYMDESLPRLGFPDGAFDLALCSHFLFLYSEQLGLEFHLAALRELCRVAREVRVFPLLDMASRRSAHLDRAIELLTQCGHDVRIVRVDYEFLKGADEMLRVARATSP
jgi:hypothetical protein